MGRRNRINNTAGNIVKLSYCVIKIAYKSLSDLKTIIIIFHIIAKEMH